MQWELPDFVTVRTSEGGPPRGAEVVHQLVVFCCSHLGCSHAEALEVPVAVAQYDYICHLEAEGPIRSAHNDRHPHHRIEVLEGNRFGVRADHSLQYLEVGRRGAAIAARPVVADRHRPVVEIAGVGAVDCRVAGGA